jgi:hypothetical protein
MHSSTDSNPTHSLWQCGKDVWHIQNVQNLKSFLWYVPRTAEALNRVHHNLLLICQEMRTTIFIVHPGL